MNIKDKNGNSDLNAFQLIWLGILIFIFYCALWNHGVEYSVERGTSVEPSQWDGFGTCFVFTAMVYGFIKLCRKIGGW